MALQPIESLTSEQRSLLALLAERGVGNVQVAQRLRISLEEANTKLDELYTALGIDSTLPKPERRAAAVGHFLKNAGTLAAFEQKTPAALLEGLKPWQREILALLAQGKQVKEIALERGLSPDSVEDTLGDFMRRSKTPTRDSALEALKRVMDAVSKPVPSERGYSTGSDKASGAPTTRPRSEAPQNSASGRTSETTKSAQESAPVSAPTISTVSSAPVVQPTPVIPSQPVVEQPASAQVSTTKPASPLAAAATREKSTMNTQSSTASSAPAVVTPLPERIKAYMEEHNLTVKQFTDRAGMASSTFYKIQKGEKVGDAATKRAEAVMQGKTFSADTTEEASLFDSTSEKLIGIVSDLAAGQNELDELVRLVFNRWAKVRGPEESKKFAIDILRQYLAAETDDERLETLLELRDLMKQKS